MYETSIHGDNDSFDAVTFERAIRRAALDLQRIVVQLSKRHSALRNDKRRDSYIPLTWRALLDIDEQVFADLGFQGRHPSAVREGFVRLGGSRLVDADHGMPVDWQRDEDPIPAVYAIFRAITLTPSSETA